ncbi:MAG: AarF/ABC1/UbiB kinase family protein [Planctomycetaceae bacterium]|nr:AarF/ABC1/UbiB kinase family protein [Planctomycetaceae bacterium]
MEVSEIPQFVRNAGRFREVVAILTKHGLADWLSTSSPNWVQRFRGKDERPDRWELTTEQRLRVAFTELGTTFIKLGQVLSTRPDLVGSVLAEELSELRANTPADKPELVRAMIESELGRPVEELFATFESTAMASASIGQVHRATTHSGRHVVVKVQHAGIEKHIINDLEIMCKLAELAENHSANLRRYRPVKTTREFRKTLMRELDFNREQRNMVRFRRNFDDDPGIVFPEPHLELCSRRVLTMDLFEGISISDKKQLESSGYDLEVVARRGANLFLEMIFRDGFYHADPHPGNLLVMSSEFCGSDKKSATSAEGPVIGVLDCGMVGQIDDVLREDLELALYAAINQDADHMSEIVARLGEVPADFDEAGLRNDIQEFLAEYTNQTLDKFDLSGCLNGIIDIIRSHQIYLPAKVAMLLKVLIMLEGTAQQLNARFSLAEMIEPYGEIAIRRRYSPRRLFAQMKSRFQDWDRLAAILPKDLADILHNIKRGKFDVHLEHRNLEPVVNRLVLGILTAALFIGSASLCSYEVPPVYRGFSVPGCLGSAVSLAMGWSITRAIHRSGRFK